MTTTYLIIATIIFLILGMIWKKSDFVNVLFKAIFWVMGLVGGVITLMEMGYLIQMPVQ